jgi:membrane-bound lytic murein transglycosylase A
MIAQDTGSAIIGPARADLFFGAGQEAGRVSGRLRHPMRFVMLVPKGLDPTARAARLPLPDPRPSEKIAKLFPQTDPAKGAAKPAAAAGAAEAKTDTVAIAGPIPLPAPRPVIEPAAEPLRPAKKRPHRQQ